jgi:chitodextrinase
VTIVSIKVQQDSAAGLVPAEGRLEWVPTARRDVGDAVVVPAPFTVRLVDGVASVDVAPSTVEWAWTVREYFVHNTGRERTVAVPTVGPVAYADLTPVDPATLLPTAEPEAIWYTEFDAMAAAAIGAVFHVSDTAPTETTRHGVPVIWIDTSDVTAPSAPTNLAGTAGETTMDLSWTASTDDVGVTGYRVSSDNGATWITSTVTGTTYQVTGLTAGTSYTFAVAAGDAAGNWSTNATLIASTTAAAAVADVTEDFNVAAGTSYAGKTTTTGALAWVDVQGDQVGHSPTAVSVDGTQATVGGARLDPTVASASVSIDFTVDAASTSEQVALWLLGAAGGGVAPFFAQVRGGKKVHVFTNDGTTTTEVAAVAITNTTGRLALTNDGTNLRVLVDGTAVAGPFATPATANKSVGFSVKHDTAAVTTPARADNFAVDYA